MVLAITPPAQIIGVLLTSTGDAWMLRLSCASCGSVYVQMRDTGYSRCSTANCGGLPASWPHDSKEA